MKRKMIKGAVSAALVLAMTASVVGCGKKNKSSADPALAKENVYSYENIDLGIDSDTYYNVVTAGNFGGKAKLIVESYPEEGETYSVYELSAKGDIERSYILEKITVDEDDLNLEEFSYDDDDDDYEDAVGELDDSHPDMAVLTTGVVYAVEDNNEVFEAYDDDYSFDEDYYYDDYDYYQEDYINANTSINYVSITDDGSIVGIAEYYCSGFQNGNYVYADIHFVCKWDNNGAIVWQNNLTDLTGSSWLYIENGILLQDGSYFAIVNGEVRKAYTFDANGNCVSDKEMGQSKEFDSIESLVPMKDGRLLLLYYDMDDDYKTKCVYVDANTLAVKEEVVLPEIVKSSGGQIYQGYDTDMITTVNAGLVKFNVGDSEATLFMDYINSDIESGHMENIIMLDEEHFIASYYDFDYNKKVAYFTYVDPKDIPDKELINIAVYYIDYDIRAKIIDFNKTNDKYRIIVTNYYDFATEDDYTAGYKKMNNDIISGNCPDIVIASEDYINYSTYANKGMLVNFDDLFEKDEELKDEDYLTNVFDAFSINGKHYVAVYAFNFNSCMGSSNTFGNADSWTISDFKKMQSTFPAGYNLFPYSTQDNFLSSVMTYDGYEFVDVETGKCDFDSEDFITLLEYAATLPKEIDYGDEYWMSDYAEQFRSGKTILNTCYIYDMSWYQQSRYEYFDGKTAMVGFPSRTGESSIITSDGSPIAIFSKGNVEGSWEFVRQFFTKDFQDSVEYSIPVLKSSFDKWADKGMERPYWEYDGEINYYDNYYYVDGVEHIVPVMTQEEVDYVKSTIMNCSKRSYYNQEILEIIEEEASACFAGQKSASEVAAVIQSRVQLYINENN